MIIPLIRQKAKGKAVPGIMTVECANGVFTIPTLENADYIIPEGIYPLKMTWSPKFKKFMPEICNVPERDGIRIHCGTKPEHSQGCVLVQNQGALETVKASINFVNKFCEDERLEIQIRLETPTPDHR